MKSIEKLGTQETYKEACREIALKILDNEVTRESLERIKKKVSRKYRLSKLPSNPDIFKTILEELDNEIEKIEEVAKILKLKPVRTISGIAVVSVMSSPMPCPHGRCVPCPGGKNTPQSYTGKEPAAMRGIQHSYNPFNQVTARLSELRDMGHSINKVEIIVMGGTFPARDKKEKDAFILGIYNALNSFNSRKKTSYSIENAKRLNEKAKVRCIGMTFETRPDYSRKQEIIEMLKYGGTKVELGVQSIYEDVLEKIKRGHGIKEVKIATELLKDSAFKVGYHIMPGLPGSDFDKDLKMFKEIFENDDFKPDYIKIYPTLVIEGTELYEMYERGEYKPYTTDEVADLISMAKKDFPVWVRVQRIQRDIPVKYAIGLDKGNLRQIVHRKMAEKGWKCRCIRCREVGHAKKNHSTEKIISDSEIMVRKYRSSNGVEFFISYENLWMDVLSGFIRLRFGEPWIEEIENHALIRELHVYGVSLPFGERDRDAVQHRGIGELLLKQAEEIAKEKYDKIAVISGVGVRDYYRKHGYRKKGDYMVKRLKN